MRKAISIVLTFAMLITAAGAALAEGNAAAGANAAPNQDGTRWMGQITAIGDNTVTISVGGAMQTPQDGTGQQNGSGPQGNGAAPDGTAPQSGDGVQNGNGAQNGGGQQGGGAQGGGTPPTGNAPDGNAPQNGAAPQNGDGAQNGNVPAAPGNETSMTLTITADTTFTSGATMETLSFGDLVVGMLVEVTTSGDATDGYTALTIQTLAAQPTEDATDSTADTQTESDT
jgi:hypothetical protein